MFNKKEYSKKYNREYYQRNKIRCKESRQRKIEEYKKYQKEWREKNIERLKEYHKEYDKEHQEQHKEYQKEWSKKNPEKIKIYRDNWLNRHPEKIGIYREKYKEYFNNYQKERRKKQKLNPDYVHPEVLRRFGINPKEIFKRDNWNCCQCSSKENLTLHHIDGQGRNSKNPNNDINNLITLCRSCHSRIHGKERRKEL